MPIWQDFRTGRRVVRDILRRRRNRSQAARLIATNPPPEAGSIQIAVYFADTRVNLYQLRQWYAPLVELAKTWPVAIITDWKSVV